MIEWLNNYISTDWATYLGAFLAVLSLTRGGGNVLKK